MSIPSLCNRILFSNVSRFSEKCYGKKGENWNLVISVYKRWLISINFHVFWDNFKRRSFDIQTDLFDTCLISTTNCTKVCLFPTFWGYVLNLFFFNMLYHMLYTTLYFNRTNTFRVPTFLFKQLHSFRKSFNVWYQNIDFYIIIIVWKGCIL